MSNLSTSQIQTYAQNAGFTGDALQTSVAVAQAESSGNPGVTGDLAITPGGSVGLWQINLKAHPEYTAAELMDPQTNANAAFKIYTAAKSNFTPWTTYNTGAYLTYLGQGAQGPQGPQLVNASLTTTSGQTVAANGYVYGYTGPPFNFLGHFCMTQWNAFQAYLKIPTGNLPAIQQFYQIRAAQLRKTAGVLTKFYTVLNDEVLTATFTKGSWKAAPGGQFGYVFRDDQLPMVAMSKIKDYLRPQFQRQDESVFTLNQIRNIIEKTEDKAQYAWQAVNDSTQSISTLLTNINGYFGKAEYEFVLVNDQTDVYPAGSTQPRGRVHQLDAPTQYEREQTAHALPGQTVNIKEVPS